MRNQQYYDDLIGRKFNSLTIESLIGFVDRIDGRRAMFLCRCDCGKEKKATLPHLKKGNVKSCGCQKQGCFNKRWKGYGGIPRSVWHQFIVGAKIRELPFEISIEFGWGLFEKQKGKCALSGVGLVFNTRLGENTASLDRIDSSLGYTETNVQWVHKHVNRMKVDFQQDYFVNVCRQIAETHPKTDLK